MIEHMGISRCYGQSRRPVQPINLNHQHHHNLPLFLQVLQHPQLSQLLFDLITIELVYESVVRNLYPAQCT